MSSLGRTRTSASATGHRDTSTRVNLQQNINPRNMATLAPRVAQAMSSTAASIPARLRTSSAIKKVFDAPTQLFPQRLSSRPFSTTYRYAATPASTYAHKPAEPKEEPSNAKSAPIDDVSPLKDMTSGLADEPLILDEGTRQVDWARSFHGLSSQPFSKEAAETLLAPIPFDDVEVKPDGIVYLPEIKYRRILNKAFGPGGWGLAPRGETIVTGKSITREYALVAHGRYVCFDSSCQRAEANCLRITD